MHMIFSTMRKQISLPIRVPLGTWQSSSVASDCHANRRRSTRQPETYQFSAPTESFLGVSGYHVHGLCFNRVSTTDAIHCTRGIFIYLRIIYFLLASQTICNTSDLRLCRAILVWHIRRSSKQPTAQIRGRRGCYRTRGIPDLFTISPFVRAAFTFLSCPLRTSPVPHARQCWHFTCSVII